MASSSLEAIGELREVVLKLLKRGASSRRRKGPLDAATSSTSSTSSQDDSFFSCFDERSIEVHARFLVSGLKHLSSGFSTLDASRPWILYWILHGLSLLGIDYGEERLGLADWHPHRDRVSEELVAFLKRAPTRAACVNFLAGCQNGSGGYGGGPQQLSHVATTYAAVAALIELGGKDALDQVDKAGIVSFLTKMQVKEGDSRGAFTVHVGGEVDMRACYLAMAVVRMLGLDPSFLDVDSMVEYIRSCQTYEGGFGGEPGNEAHGGYSYCAFAALALVGREADVEPYQLLEWASNRQQPIEGGFNGRTNKLVDSCYSFWQGGLLCLLSEHFGRGLGVQIGRDYHSEALQDWILLCCQLPDGGLRDKPGTNPDYYHTCYSLSGLSLSFRSTSPRHCQTDLFFNVRKDKLVGIADSG